GPRTNARRLKQRVRGRASAVLLVDENPTWHCRLFGPLVRTALQFGVRQALLRRVLGDIPRSFSHRIDGGYHLRSARTAQRTGPWVRTERLEAVPHHCAHRTRQSAV